MTRPREYVKPVDSSTRCGVALSLLLIALGVVYFLGHIVSALISWGQ